MWDDSRRLSHGNRSHYRKVDGAPCSHRAPAWVRGGFLRPTSVFQEKGVGTMRILESPECQTDSVEGGQARTFFQYPPNGGWPSEKGKGTRSLERPLPAGCGLGSPAVTVHPPICFKISLLFFASVAPQQFGDHVTDDRENGSPPGEARRPEGLP